MSAAVGVLIIDESETLDSSLRATLEHEPALHTVGEGDLGACAGECVVALVVLPDTGLTSTIARIASLKQRRADLKVLLAFQSLDGEALRALLAAGTDAVVARQASPREVCAALLGLIQVGTAPAPDIASRGTELADGLTPREAEILRFLSAGFSNKEVARRLSLSVRTVETHRLNLRRKTQTGRLKDLVALARKLGLAPVMDTETPRRAHVDPVPGGLRTTLDASAHY